MTTKKKAGRPSKKAKEELGFSLVNDIYNYKPVKKKEEEEEEEEGKDEKNLWIHGLYDSILKNKVSFYIGTGLFKSFYPRYDDEDGLPVLVNQRLFGASYSELSGILREGFTKWKGKKSDNIIFDYEINKETHEIYMDLVDDGNSKVLTICLLEDR